jgi:hypothetical protein
MMVKIRQGLTLQQSLKHPVIVSRLHHACMIGASGSMKTMQLIEGSNQMDYLLVLLDYHDYFPSQMI